MRKSQDFFIIKSKRTSMGKENLENTGGKSQETGIPVLRKGVRFLSEWCLSYVIGGKIKNKVVLPAVSG